MVCAWRSDQRPKLSHAFRADRLDDACHRIFWRIGALEGGSEPTCWVAGRLDRARSPAGSGASEIGICRRAAPELCGLEFEIAGRYEAYRAGNRIIGLTMREALWTAVAPATAFRLRIVGCDCDQKAAAGATALQSASGALFYCASTTHRNPNVPARSLLGAINRYFPCSVSL